MQVLTFAEGITNYRYFPRIKAMADAYHGERWEMKSNSCYYTAIWELRADGRYYPTDWGRGTYDMYWVFLSCIVW